MNDEFGKSSLSETKSISNSNKINLLDVEGSDEKDISSAKEFFKRYVKINYNIYIIL